MFKKLLLVTLVLTLALGLCGLAIAAKGPSEVKKFPTSIPQGAARPALTNSITSIAPIIPTIATQLTGTPRSGSLNRAPSATCTDVFYDNCYPGYYWPFAGIRGGAVRFETGPTELCSLKRADLYMVPTGVGTGGITVYVWGDDGFGFPGAVLFSVPVPHGSITFLPGVTAIPLPASLVLTGTYHVGFKTNLAGDRYDLLTDDGTCGTGRSNVFFDIPPATWIPWPSLVAPPDNDFNWAITVNTCCFIPTNPGICSTLGYDCGPAFRISYPAPWAMKFTATGDCSLKTAKYRISAGGQLGTGGITAYVYSDAAGFPGALLASVPVAHGSIVYSPNLTTVNFSSFNLVFNNVDYHIGFQVTNLGVDSYQPVVDNGTCGTGRSSFFDIGFTNTWVAMADPINGFGTDYNFLFKDSVCCVAPPPPLCFNVNYSGPAAYYWGLPDIYGDDFFNMRFTNADFCTLKAINMAFYGAGTIGNPGATVYIWNSDGTFPTSVITSYVIDPVAVFFPAYENVDVSAANIAMAGDYHVGYSPIVHAPGEELAILSDNGSTANLRASEYWSGSWGLMAVDWLLDVSFLINVDICCTPPGFCPIVCSPTDQWPTFAHDYSRTGQSQLTLGDLCGVVRDWVYDAVKPINFAGPTIASDKVLVANDDRVIAVDLMSGILVWDTKVLPGYATAIPSSGLRGQITTDGGAVYFGTGSFRGFAKANLATGALIWARGTGVANPLPGTAGQTRFAGSIVRGNEVYFGDDNSQVYALNATTGADLYPNAQLYTDAANTIKGGIFGAPSTDGSQLFFGLTANLHAGSGLGAVIAVQPGGGFVQNWKHIGPNQAVLHESFASGATFRCDNLFVHATHAFGLNGQFAGYRQNLDPSTGAEQWLSTFAMGQNLYASPAADNERVYFPNINNGFLSTALSTRSIRAVSFLNSTVWLNTDIAGGNAYSVWTPPIVTCDPWVIYGTSDVTTAFADNHVIFADATTGAVQLDYLISARITGVAVASASDGYDYVVATMAFRNNSTANPARIIGFKLGDPRPRLYVPQLLVNFTGTNTSELAPVQRIDVAAVENTGCLTLNVTGTLDALAPPLARSVSSVHPSLVNKANQLASELVDYSVDAVFSRQSPVSALKGGNMALVDTEADNVYDFSAAGNEVKSLPANSSRLAPPTWVTWINPVPVGPTVVFSVAPSGSQNFTFEFDRSGMNFLAPNIFYVYLDTDDPDYAVEVWPGPQPSPQAAIEYQIPYEYCGKDTGRIDFGVAGGAWTNNYGTIADGNVGFEFTLTGSDNYSYSGTMYFMTNMNNAAWNPATSNYNFQYLFPFYIGPFAGQDCGGCQIGVNLPVDYTTDGGASYNPPVGDICTFAMIDSLQGLLSVHQAGPSIGLLINYRIVGTYGADFDGFVLYVVDINNRNSGTVTGLYYGNFEDWDIGADAGFANPAKGYVYQDDGDARGYIGLPLEGSYWPDGSKTDPMYNARVIENGLWVYPSAPCSECIIDSLYALVNGLPEGGFVLDPPGTTEDRSTLATFGKANILGYGVKSYGFAIYGLDASANINGDTEAMSLFVNKYSGFARGDVNDDGLIDLRDLVRLSRYVATLGPGPEPFLHLGDVDNDNDVDVDDCTYLAAYYFSGGTPPKSAFKF